MGWILFILFLIGLFALISLVSNAESKHMVMEGISQSDVINWGQPHLQMICPHCQQGGKVLSKSVTKKTGVSGAKATGAILTGGVSLLATGLSKKDKMTQAHCLNCDSTWHF
jgi:hypothetical protein